MSDAISTDILSSNDFRLVEEAVRRLEVHTTAETIGKDALFGILTDQLRRGRRDMFTLVRVGRRAIDDH